MVWAETPHVILDVAGVAFVVIAAWFWWKGARAIVRGRRSRTWPVASGVVKTAQVVKKQNREGVEVWRHKIEYAYSVGANRYRGSRIQFGIPNALLWNDPQLPSFRLFRPKEVIDVFYNPSRPSIAALQRGYSPFVFLTLAAGAAIVWMGFELLTLPG